MASAGLTSTQIANYKENIKIDVRSLLCSAKEGLTERELKFEYRELNGEDIPFGKLGYNSLNDLLKTFDFVQIRRHGQSWLYFALHDEKTKNLGRLVHGQLDPKKPFRERRRLNEGKYKYQYNQYDRSQSSHFSSSNFYQHKISVFSPTRNDKFTFNNTDIFVPHDVQKSISNLLKRHVNFRLSLHDLDIEYKKLNGFDLNPKSFGFNTLIELFEYLDHLVYIEYPSVTSQSIDPKFIYIGLSFSNCDPNSSQKQLEEQTIENLKSLIESNEPDGIDMSFISKAYKEKYSVEIPVQKLGFKNLISLFSEVMYDFVAIKQTNDGYKVYKNSLHNINMDNSVYCYDNNDNDSDSDNLTVEDKEKKRLNLIKIDKNDLIEIIEKTFKEYIGVRLKEDEFLSIFEKHNMFKLDHLKYGFNTADQLRAMLNEIGIIKFDFDSKFDLIYTYSPEYVENKEQMNLIEKTNDSEKFFTQNALNTDNVKTKKDDKNKRITDEDLEKEVYAHLNPKERELYEWKKHQAEFLMDYVIYDQDLDREELHKKLLEKRDHAIIVSNVTNPCNIQIQLAENVNELNKLMDDLEKCYYGLTSGYYDMPEEYVIPGKLCVALFDLDQNWHRCKILQVFKKTKLVRVLYIDYGGEADVPINSLKFLLKEFTYLPVQAIDARFANIKPIPENLWRKDIINYLLNRLMNKIIQARVFGIRKSFVSLEMYERTTSENNGRPSGTLLHINKRIVIDGYAELYDEESDPKFMSYNSWRERTDLEELYKEMSKNASSDASTRSMLSSSTIETTNSINNKDINNNLNNQEKSDNKTVNTSNSAHIQKLVYLAEDELTKDSVLKQKRVKVKTEFREIEVNLISIDGKIYIHSFDVARLVDQKHSGFEKAYIRSNILAKELYSDEVFFTKFENNENNQELFDWIYSTIDLDYDLTDDTYLFVYDKLFKFLEFFFIEDKVKMINQRINEAIKTKKSVDNLNNKLTSLSINNTDESKLDQEINSLKNEISLCEIKCDKICSSMKNLNPDSVDYKELMHSFKVNSQRKENYLNQLKKLKQ